MEVEILSFEKNIAYDRIGIVRVRYHEMTLSLNLKTTPDRKYTWLEMPKAERGKSKYYLCKWDSKEVSDTFQKLALKKLQEKYPDALIIPTHEEIRKLLNDLKRKSQEALKNEIANKCELPIEKEGPPPKARNQSKFEK